MTSLYRGRSWYDMTSLSVYFPGADPDMRDHSGRKAKQYLKHSASTRSQRKHSDGDTPRSVTPLAVTPSIVIIPNNRRHSNATILANLTNSRPYREPRRSITINHLSLYTDPSSDISDAWFWLDDDSALNAHWLVIQVFNFDWLMIQTLDSHWLVIWCLMLIG